MQRNRFTKRALATGAALGAALGLAAAGLTGCSSADDKSDGGAQEAITLENAAGSWTMENGNGPDGEFEALEDAPVTLEIEKDGAFSGTSGCNNIFGTMTIEGDKVDLGAVGQTMMACPDEMMTLENKYTQALNDVDAGDVDGDKLVLRGTDSEINYKRA